jgi:ElaB/YqjD/DUF883 family membrane-anchored ribosome-binding protein
MEPRSHDNGSASRVAEDLRRQASAELEQMRERFEALNDRVVGFIRERPGTAILVALGAGFLVGRLLRS